MKVLQDDSKTFAEKRRKINSLCASSVEHQDVIDALLEQLTLVE